MLRLRAELDRRRIAAGVSYYRLAQLTNRPPNAVSKMLRASPSATEIALDAIDQALTEVETIARNAAAKPVESASRKNQRKL